MKKREEHHPLSTLLAMSNLGRKEFQWYTKRYYDQYANRTAFRCVNTFNQYLSYTKISRRIEYAQ